MAGAWDTDPTTLDPVPVVGNLTGLEEDVDGKPLVLSFGYRLGGRMLLACVIDSA